MPGFRLASFDTDGLAVATGAVADERLILQALAVGETAADVVALQGVAGAAALDGLSAAMRLAVGRDYRHALVIDGNDAVVGHQAVLSHLPIVHARSYRRLSFAEVGALSPPGLEPGAAVFGRDCLEVAVEQQGRCLTLFVCRFAASPAGASLVDGPDPAHPRRQAEALAVRHIVERRFADPAAAEWVVAGNLADAPADVRGRPDPNHALRPLLADGFAVAAGGGAGGGGEDWTHYDPVADRYRRLDHILLSPALARRNRDGAVRIVRGGLPYRAERHAGPRYPRIGWLAPGASWHCPVVLDLTFTGEPGAAPPARPRRYRSGGGRPGRAL
jgi:hypothetical protein